MTPLEGGEGALSGRNIFNQRSRSSSGIRDCEDEAELFVPKLLDSKPSQPSDLADLRGARRGVGERMPCSTSAFWFGDLRPEPEASGSASSSLSSW